MLLPQEVPSYSFHKKVLDLALSVRQNIHRISTLFNLYLNFTSLQFFWQERKKEMPKRADKTLILILVQVHLETFDKAKIIKKFHFPYRMNL